jgi:hypothetical protein
MRFSLYLAVVFFLVNFAYGFSAKPPSGRVAPFRVDTSSVRNSPSLSAQAHSWVTIRGGAQKTSTRLKSGPINNDSKCPVTGVATVAASIWGTGGVLYILAKAIKRVLPIALEPFVAGAVPLNQVQLGAYIATCLWFAYVEGYKGFQLKFSPLVVKRSFTLVPGKNGTSWYHFVLAPFYSMGLVHATKKRKIISWSVSIGVAGIVAAVKRFPYPWRNIVDAGVVVGLTWGSLSILLIYVKSWMTGQPPQQIDAALPTAKK